MQLLPLRHFPFMSHPTFRGILFFHFSYYGLVLPKMGFLRYSSLYTVPLDQKIYYLL